MPEVKTRRIYCDNRYLKKDLERNFGKNQIVRNDMIITSNSHPSVVDNKLSVTTYNNKFFDNETKPLYNLTLKTAEKKSRTRNRLPQQSSTLNPDLL